MSTSERVFGGGGPRGVLAHYGREARASFAFVERNYYLMKRYWGWEIAFLIYTAASSLSIMFIGESQGGDTSQLILFLGIGTLVWGYLNSVFANVAEMIAWERWEGTIEYTMMAPVSRLTHMLGVSIFAIIYGIARSICLLGVLALFFEIDLAGANLGAALLVIVIGSVSFIGFGIMGAVLPLLFPEKGEQMTFCCWSQVSTTRCRSCRAGCSGCRTSRRPPTSLRPCARRFWTARAADHSWAT
jgi:ABC-2 type transport system permease protein